jgi:hypothetical protein
LFVDETINIVKIGNYPPSKKLVIFYVSLATNTCACKLFGVTTRYFVAKMHLNFKNGLGDDPRMLFQGMKGLNWVG